MIIKTVKFICLTITAIAVSFIFSNIALAEKSNEIYTQFWNGSNWENLDGKFLFSEANFLPNDSVNRRVKVTNEEAAGGQGESHKIAVKAVDYTIDNDYNLAKVLFIVISEEYASDDLYGGSNGEKTLIDFYNEGEIYLSTLENNASSVYNFAVTFNPDADNNWNQKDGDKNVRDTKFDIKFGLQGEDSISEEIKIGGGGGGGGIFVAGLTINNERAISTLCKTATITWNTNLFSTSRVIYCRADDINCALDLGDTYNNPNLYGYSFTTIEQDNDPKVTGQHTVELTELAESTEYVYRCISHASPATIGYEKSFTTPVCPVIVLGEEGAPELTISKTVNAEFANPGDTVTYKVDVTNNGNMTAYNAILIDTLPAGFTFVDSGSASKTWQLGDMAPGQTKGAEYDVAIDSSAASGIYANIAQVSADNHDPVSAYVDLEVKKITILGIELAPTGFSVKEFIILILALVMIVGSAVVLRKRYL